ncbi:fibronectin type III domain-containing protein (plasmid) [Bacillus velezensis]|uniref:fibronectin type III domain-containing protein n=1 Tax=Bacillus velezensis TaxID=492670 RepID=UPI0020245D18|nr:fibronectin type III domain-containing protein [Bacillus velezensis]URJ72544.1 fibronectin type III domain-containing protein [Bacillus velezensis]URJ72562.1 fibronectin type III domain-containing protein [Bacillus velezensis]URJ80311.1 fibronectin type III domain-containing protein [Bacillus velezensis]URJ80328.1 fibronectin type III domain-containing protein [Bacillus velezensis]
MKKILFLLIFLFILTPHTLATEQKTSLVSGMSTTYLGCAGGGVWEHFKFSSSTTTNITDMDETTYAYMSDAYCGTSNSAFMYEFDYPVTVGSYYLSEKSEVGEFGANVFFYDENKKLIGSRQRIFYPLSQSPVNKQVNFKQRFSTPYEGVKYVVFSNSQNWKKYRIYEFQLYDYEPPPDGVSDLSYKSTSNTVEVSYKLPSKGFSYLKIYKNGELLKDRYTDSTLTVEDLKPETEYKFEFISISDDGAESQPSAIVTKTKELEKPDNVSDLDYDFTSTSLKASYKLPAENFSHLEVYKNNTLIKGNLKDNQLEVSDLLPNTKYDFKIVTVGANGAKSDGVHLQFETPEQHDPPSKPTGLYMDNGNGALTLSWNRNPEKDIEGYNVYLDGKKLNSGLISNTFYTVGHLKNGSKYQMSVEAVNTSKLVSDKADTMGYPNVKGMPLIENDYSLVDVTNGVSVWFGSIWLILAFAVSIPLAFYISHRVKALFFP